MRALVQRVSHAQVSVAGRVTGSIGAGLLVFLAITHDDQESDADYLARKIVKLRLFDRPGDSQEIFPAHDKAEEKMNFSLGTSRGVLVISQFTLYGDARRGNRPSFIDAAPSGQARHLYDYFLSTIRGLGASCESGVFQETMQVESVNEGPVTLILDSKVT